MKKCGLFLIFVLVLIPFSVQGLMCGNVDKVKYSSLANNITVSAEAINVGDQVRFQLTFLNVGSTLRIEDARTGASYQSDSVVLGNLAPNTSYRFLVYPTVGSCQTEAVRTIYYTTPGYNPYYADAVCKGIENYSLCQRWNQVNLSYDQFLEKVATYKQELQTPPDDGGKEETIKGIYDYIIDFFLDYYFIILPVIIIGLSIVIIRLRRKEEFF